MRRVGCYSFNISKSVTSPTRDTGRPDMELFRGNKLGLSERNEQHYVMGLHQRFDFQNHHSLILNIMQGTYPNANYTILPESSLLTISISVAFPLTVCAPLIVVVVIPPSERNVVGSSSPSLISISERSINIGSLFVCDELGFLSDRQYCSSCLIEGPQATTMPT